MKFMICDRDVYHDIPVLTDPKLNKGCTAADKYAAIMYNYKLEPDKWYQCELLNKYAPPDMPVYGYDIQIKDALKYILVLKSEIDAGYVKFDFEEGETDGT